MVNYIKYGFLFCASFVIIGFSSCSTENLDVTTIEDEEVIAEVVSCDNSLSLMTSQIDFSEVAEARLYKSKCGSWGSTQPMDEFTTYEYNYLIYDAAFDILALEEPVQYQRIFNGMPAICFGSNESPKIGDVYTPYDEYIDCVFIFDDIHYYGLRHTTVTITATGDEIGETIAGTIAGKVFTQTDELFDITGSFCVEIVGVCE